MLLGQYNHILDGKNRLSLPSKVRRQLGKKVIVTKGLDGCLFLYTEKDWKNFSDKMSDLPMGQADTRAFSRFILGSATEIDIDSNGRILLPSVLASFAKLKSKVVIAGVYSRMEIWDEKAWDKHQAENEKRADALAEKLGDIGMI
ncbi:MAG: MraZ protein [Flavobacteriaceae bacterium]|jgi:MraZ protein